MPDAVPPPGLRPYPELTWTAVILGWLLGVVIAVSIGYAALILGFSIEGSELAAILGFGILRGILRRKSIIENNIVQTVASAVNAASAWSASADGYAEESAASLDKATERFRTALDLLQAAASKVA